MKISEIQIIPIKAKNGLIAICSLVFDNNLYLSSIGVHSRRDGSGYRLTYPTKKVGNRNINIYHPINKETSKLIESSIFSEINKIFI
jgi:DNA-binding cell septation regulator SpoVG